MWAPPILPRSILRSALQSAGYWVGAAAQGVDSTTSIAMLELTLEQLVEHDGSDPGKPLYISVQGRIFDVTAGAQFYGPGERPLYACQLTGSPIRQMLHRY